MTLFMQKLRFLTMVYNRSTEFAVFVRRQEF
jgi:hypothetical protein